MAEVLGSKNLILKLQQKRVRSEKDGKVDCVVGYTQHYAIYVHENLEAYHKVGQALFLMEPFRRLQPEFVKIIVRAMKNKVPFPRALLMAGLRLQAESQLLCPVLTGALKNSAFTRLEDRV
jgi:hypothetical protein